MQFFLELGWHRCGRKCDLAGTGASLRDLAGAGASLRIGWISDMAVIPPLQIVDYFICLFLSSNFSIAVLYFKYLK